MSIQDPSDDGNSDSNLEFEKAPTDTYTKSCPAQDCPLKTKDNRKTKMAAQMPTDRDTWLNSRIIKIAGVVYAIGSPYIVWVTVSLFQMKAHDELLDERIKNLQEKQAIVAELSATLQLMRGDISKIQTDIAVINARAGKP